MKLLTKEGNPMVEILSFEVEGSRLVIKSRIMSNIRTTLYVSPDSFWEGLKLCRRRAVILYFLLLPFRLTKNLWRKKG
jgi:hypothetical protein